MRTNRSPAAGPSEARERILGAALRSFAEKGYDGATTREIASRAEVPLGLLRYYFGGKLKLWQAAVDRAFGEIQSGLDAATTAPQSGDVLEGIRTSIRAHVHYVARNPEFVRLMYDEGKRRGPRMRWLVDRHVKPMFARLLPMIRRLQEIGRLPADIPPLHFAYALIGRARGKRFVVLSGADRIEYDADGKDVEDEPDDLKRKGAAQEARTGEARTGTDK